MPPWTARTRAKNDLENHCLILTTTVQWVKVRNRLYSGDEQGTVLQAVKQLRDWLDKNQHAEKDEFEARHEQVRRVVNRIMNETRNKEYEEEMMQEMLNGKGIGKSDDPAKGKGKGKGFGKSDDPVKGKRKGPIQPPQPPPAYLLHGKGGASGSGGPYFR